MSATGTAFLMLPSINTTPSMASWISRMPGSLEFKVLEDENGKLKKLLAEAMLDIAILKDVASKNGNARYEAGSGGPYHATAWREPASGV